MARPGDAARRSTVQFETKASVLRSVLDELERAGRYDAVLSALDPAARATVLDPPPSSAWIDGRVVLELQDVMYDLFGAEVLKRMQADAIRAGISPLLRTAVEGTLRLFGTSPAALLSRMGMLSASTVRGIEYIYEPTGPRAGIMVMRFARGTGAPLSAFVASSGGLTSVFDSCGVRGTISDPEMVQGSSGTVARYRVSW